MLCEGYMLVTRDIKAAKEFYTGVVGAEVVLDIGTHVVFKDGFSLLLEQDWKFFAQLDGLGLSYRHHTGQLVFAVDDIAAFVRRLEAMPEPGLLHPVKEHPWGRWAVRLYDPDGHVVEVGESMKVVIKRFLGQGLTPEATAEKSEFPLSYVLMCKAEMEGAKSGVPAARRSEGSGIPPEAG